MPEAIKKALDCSVRSDTRKKKTSKKKSSHTGDSRDGEEEIQAISNSSILNQLINIRNVVKMSTGSGKSVIVVGAGPVGLLTALRLGREGIDTLVLEKSERLVHATRALVYHPLVPDLLEDLEVLPKVLEAGYLNTQGITWRKLNGDEIAHMKVEGEEAEKFGGVLMIGQSRMNEIYLEELKKYPSVDVVFGAACTGVEETPTSVKVMTWQKSNREQDITYEGDYVLAADGAGSTVRRSLCVPFQGYSWPYWKAFSAQVQYDFITENGWGPISIIVDQHDWAIIELAGEDAEGRDCRPEKSIFRVVYGEHPDLPQSNELIMERAISQVSKYTKKGSPCKVIGVEPYYLQQRCAAQARKGRVVFAGDALHVNNPSGGLGLTTGIIDAICYGNALSRVINNGEPEELLTECATSRRDAWLDFTGPISEKNFKRDSATQDPEGIEFSKFFFEGLNDDPEFATKIKEMHHGVLLKSFARPTNQGSSKQQGKGALAIPVGKNSNDSSNGYTEHISNSISLNGRSNGLPNGTTTKSCEDANSINSNDVEHIENSVPSAGQKPRASAFHFLM